MVLSKDKAGMNVIIAIFLIIALFVHGYILYEGGLTLLGLKLHLYASPISAMLIFFAYRIYRSIRNKLYVTESEILIDDFGPVAFPRNIVVRASLKEQVMPMSGVNQWLILHTKNDNTFMNPKIKKLNKFIGIGGVAVCNLSFYKCSASEVVASINAWVKNA